MACDAAGPDTCAGNERAEHDRARGDRLPVWRQRDDPRERLGAGRGAHPGLGLGRDARRQRRRARARLSARVAERGAPRPRRRPRRPLRVASSNLRSAYFFFSQSFKSFPSYDVPKDCLLPLEKSAIIS